MELVSRLFMPLKKNICNCQTIVTHRWWLHAIVQVTSKREALEEKSTGARNDYVLSLAAANAHQTRYFVVDLQSTMQVGCHIVYSVLKWISGCNFGELIVCSGIFLTWFCICNSNMEMFYSWLSVVLSSYCMSILAILLHIAVNLTFFCSVYMYIK